MSVFTNLLPPRHADCLSVLDVAHKHVDLGAAATANISTRLRLRARDVRREFESRHHTAERQIVAESPRQGLARRVLLSIATRTDAD